MADDGEPQKRRVPKLAMFEFNANVDHVLGKVLDGKEPPREPPGPKLPPRFVLISQLGKGAQSSVYAVFDRELNCKAALKFFKGGGEGRGVREAQALSGVEHPNVVRVQDVQLNEDGRLFMRMEIIDGPTLRKWVEGRRWREVLGAYVQAGRGLAAAHKAGIVHRDFKPENALVRDEDNRVVVVDFGLARGRLATPEIAGSDVASSSTASHSFPLQDTRSGLMGTVSYMAPEQFNGKQEFVDERTDQFNFCVALYEALDGERPFIGKSYTELADAVTRGKIKGPPRNTPPWVWRVLRRGLTVDPKLRYPSMAALLVALENDPRKWFVRVVALAVVLAVAGGARQWLQAKDDQHAEEIAFADAQTEAAEASRTIAEQLVRDRGDAVTFREAKTVMADDPTKAVALLASLSEDWTKWDDTRVRMLAADADYRIVARRVIELGAVEEPYGLSPDGTIAITRARVDGEVSLHRLDDDTREPMGVAVTGLPVVAFSPDGRRIATQRVPQGVHRRDARSGREPTLLGESSDEHHRIAFFAGTGGIVTFGRDRDVVRWHERGKQVLGGHVAPVDAVAVDSEGGWAATFDGAPELRLWDLATTKARTLTGAIAPMAFAPDGSLAVTAMGLCSELADGPVTEVRIVDPTTAETETLCTDGQLPLSSIAFSPTGKRVAAALPGRVLVWDVDTGERIDLDRPDGEASVLRFATADVLGSQSQNTTLVLWVLPSERAYVLQGHAGVAHWGRRDDGTIVTYGNEGQIRLWSLPTRSDRLLASHTHTVTHVAYAGASLVTASNDGSVKAWPRDGGENVLSAGRAEIGAMVVAPGGSRIAFTRGKGQVQIVELAGDEATVAEREQVFALAWDHAGERLAIADKDGGLDVVERSGTVRTSIREPDAYKVRGAQFDRDGEKIITAGWFDDGAISIRVYAAASGERLHEQKVDATVSPDGAELSGVVAVAFSADARRVAVTTFQRSVVVWDAEGGPRVLGKHDRLAPGAAFSPDGERLVTVDEDGVAKLWDVATGFNRTIRFRGVLRAVAFAPDGQDFVAVGDARVAFVGRDDLPRDGAALREWVEAATDLELPTAELDWAAQ